MVRSSLKYSSSLFDKSDIEKITDEDLNKYLSLKPVKYNNNYNKEIYDTSKKLVEYAKDIKKRKLLAIETRFKIKTGLSDLSNPTKEKIELLDSIMYKFTSNNEKDLDFIVLNWSRLTDNDLSTFDAMNNGNITPKEKYKNYIKYYEKVRSKILLETIPPVLIKDYGMIAEDIAPYFPEMVTMNTEGDIKGIRYKQFHALHLAAIQKLNYKIDKIMKYLNLN